MSKRESPSYPKWSIFHHDAVNQYKITLPFLMCSQPPIMYADLLCMNFFRYFSERSIVLFHFYTIYGFSSISFIHSNEDLEIFYSWFS